MWTLKTKEIGTGSRLLSEMVGAVLPLVPVLGVFQHPLLLPWDNSAQKKTAFNWRAKTKKMKT